MLSGGRGRRIGGDKATVELDGRPLISYPVGALRSAGLDVVLALRSGQEMPAGLEGVSFVHDEFNGAGPLGGLHALLKWMPSEWALVVSCDQPFVRVNLLHGLLAHLDCGVDAVVSRTRDRIQPMPGLYRKTCLPYVEQALATGEMRMRDLLDRLRLCELQAEEIGRLDLEHASFINVNTPEELATAHRLAARFDAPFSPRGTGRLAFPPCC